MAQFNCCQQFFLLVILGTLCIMNQNGGSSGIRTVSAFQPHVGVTSSRTSSSHEVVTTTSAGTTTTGTSLSMAQVSQADAQKSIDTVVKALRKDSAANTELGRLTKVNNVLGYGSPSPDAINVRFNASFQKSGKGLSSVPLPFGLGQSNKSEGRGTMVGQVKASVSTKTGKIVNCSVFRDLGYGRSFHLKV
jgi:hypothetical protein